MENNQQHGVSRRSVAKGAAWAVPAVVALGAAPKAAASVPCVPTFSFGGASCKCPGQSTNQSWGYYLQICVNLANGCPTPSDGNLYVWEVQNNSGKNLTGPAFPIVIPVGSCDNAYRLFNSTSSAHSLTFLYSYDAAGTNKTWSTPAIPAPVQDCSSNSAGDCLPPGSAAAKPATATTSSSSSTSSASSTTSRSSASSTSSAPAPSSTAPRSTSAPTSTTPAG